MREVNGGCLCGAVHYRLVGEPLMVAVCHCTTCQKNTGSAFSPNLAMRPAAVVIFGDDLATYEQRADADSPPEFYPTVVRTSSAAEIPPLLQRLNPTLFKTYSYSRLLFLH